MGLSGVGGWGLRVRSQGAGVRFDMNHHRPLWLPLPVSPRTPTPRHPTPDSRLDQPRRTITPTSVRIWKKIVMKLPASSGRPRQP